MEWEVDLGGAGEERGDMVKVVYEFSNISNTTKNVSLSAASNILLVFPFLIAT